MTARALPRLRLPAIARGWRAPAAFLAATLLIALALRAAVAMPRSIPSESMMPALYPGDTVLVLKWPYGWSRFSLPFVARGPAGRLFGRSPERGDVVVFRAPPDDRADYVKRVIGLPGDTVALAGGRVILNGRPLATEPIADFVAPLDDALRCVGAGGSVGGLQGFCRWPLRRETLPDGRAWPVIDQGPTAGDEMAPVRVPAGGYFLLGDNRDVSADSRYPAEPGGGVGLVPADNLEGRAALVVVSTGGTWTHPIGWLRGLRMRRIGRQP